ncbi:outer membrane beta-barrel protein [Rhodocytophaga rosea]|uniref:Outer membrane beta-barrel protein n=1 Tax=Rhodocytophaga rosea TaxID=2704465 RepID=A0A6C0GNC0_9BACT|nr:DUF6089 family protein [Rhodocytophaga rosea]QHT69538.1 outer membrane beta-barrel protein [Rhodocytophaga rosea]
MISYESIAQRLEIGAGGGAMLYKGDLAPELIPKFARPGATIFLRHNPGKAISLKYSFSLGRIFADDRETDDNFANQRNRFFNTRITELAATAEYNFLDYRSDKARKPWTPYLFGGIAVYKFDPVENLRPEYKLTQLALPFGVGFKYVLGGQWNLGIEFGARKIFTDYLDDLGGDLNTTNKFQNGNPNDKDMYVFTTLTVSYTFYKIRCPNFY